MGEWTMQQDDSLRARLNTGHSPGDIARHFSSEIGYRSRNAIIGRCHRLGIVLGRGNIGHPVWWTDERIDALRKLYHSPLGYTHSEMAQELDCKLSTLHKGIVKLRKADGIVKPKPSHPKPWRRMAGPPLKRPVERVRPTKPVTIVELQRTHCRAVLGDVDGARTLYCGDPIVEPYSYCAGHCAEYFRL